MKKGFTLSEALITLGVVGCIAALTIPTIVKNYKKKVYVSQLEKVYSQLTDAAQSVIKDEYANNFYESTAGVPSSCDDEDETKSKGACYFLNNYFKTVKTDCKGAGGTSCLGETYKNFDGSSSVEGSSFPGEYCIQTTNNSTICIGFEEDASYAYVDINGPAEPNMAGFDYFTMVIQPDGLVTDIAGTCGSGSDVGSWSAGCMNAIIESGWKMNY